MTKQQETTPARHRITSYWLTGIGLTIALSMFHGSEWRGDAQLHTLMEIIANLLAVFIGAITLVRFYSKKNDTFLFIGTGFLGPDIAAEVNAVLIKSKTSNEQLVKTIEAYINPPGETEE